MFEILAALAMTGYITSSVSNDIERANRANKPKTSIIRHSKKSTRKNLPAITNKDPLKAVVEHYNTRGEWAGTFAVESILNSKTIQIDEMTTELHIEYKYKAVPNNLKRRKDSGLDKRSFTLKKDGDVYTVIKMGKHQSGKL